jgi:PAS domain S-box-containing protein
MEDERDVATTWSRRADSIPHIAWISGTDGRTEHVNRLGLNYTGVPVDRLRQRGWTSVVHPDDRRGAVQGWKEAVRTGVLYDSQYRIRGADGRFRWHAVRAAPLRDANGDVEKWVGTATDIDDFIRGASLRSAVMSQVADGVYADDAEGRLTYMNRAACKMLGWAEADLRGMRTHDVIHAHLDGTPVIGTECALRTEGTQGRLMQAVGEVFLRKDGSKFPVAYSAIPLRVESIGEGRAVVFRDISEPGTSPVLIRVLIVDSDPSTSGAFEAVLNRHEGVDVVAAETTAAAAIASVNSLHPDVVLLDYALPDRDGVATTQIIKAENPDTSVILMTDNYNDTIAAGGIAAGCAGVLDKGRAWVELVSAVRAAFHGETRISQRELQRVVSALGGDARHGRPADLTDRERQVLACMTEGLSNRQVADRLGLTTNTVRNHVQRVLYKLNVHSRLEAVLIATGQGLLTSGP